MKRKCLREPGLEPEVDSQEAGAAGQVGAKRRRVEFEDVTIYSFSRRQGHTCVPSQVSHGTQSSRDTSSLLHNVSVHYSIRGHNTVIVIVVSLIFQNSFSCSIVLLTR